jgi:AraC-like DNA-binding protein
MPLADRPTPGKASGGDSAGPSAASPAPQVGSLPSSSGVIARLACARLKAGGIDPAPLLKKARVTAQQIEDRHTPLPAQAQIRVLELAAEALGDDLLGFRLAADLEPREVGLLYYVLASSETFGDALRRVARYSTIVNEGVSLRYVEPDAAILFNYVDVARHSDRHQIEFWVAAMVRLSRELTGRQFSPQRVRLTHHRQDTGEIASVLGCDVEFGTTVDEIAFPRTAKELPIASADPYLNDLLIAYCEEALAQHARRHLGLRAAIENTIVPLLPHGKAQVSDCAHRLGMSARTLARRLASEGLTFGLILDELRSDLAQRHIKDSRLSVSQIAWLLGYQEVSAFTHAFRRWTGVTPTQMRAQMRPTDENK